MRVARDQHAAVEPLGVRLALAQVPHDLGPQRRGGLRNRPNSSTTVATGASALGHASRPSLLPGAAAPDLPRRLAAVDEVEHADDLVGRQAAEQGQADVAVSLEGAQDQRDDEHLLVVADVAMIVVNRSKQRGK